MRYEHTKLSRDEQDELAVRAKGGDIEARNQLIESVLPWIETLAAKYSKQSLISHDDAIHYIVAHVLDNMRTYDCRKASFPNWVSMVARSGMVKAFRADRIIAFPSCSNVVGYEQFCEAVKTIGSLNIPVGKKKDGELHSLLRGRSPDVFELACKHELIEDFRECVNSLNPKQRAAIRMRLVGSTYQQIGDANGYTRSNAEQLVKYGFKNIAECMSKHMRDQ